MNTCLHCSEKKREKINKPLVSTFWQGLRHTIVLSIQYFHMVWIMRHGTTWKIWKQYRKNARRISVDMLTPATVYYYDGTWCDWRHMKCGQNKCGHNKCGHNKYGHNNSGHNNSEHNKCRVSDAFQFSADRANFDSYKLSTNQFNLVPTPSYPMRWHHQMAALAYINRIPTVESSFLWELLYSTDLCWVIMHIHIF